MYKVLSYQGGHAVFWLETPDAEPVLIPKAVQRPEDEVHKWEPYPQRTAAYRRCKKLNDALKLVDAMIAQDGAIII